MMWRKIALVSAGCLVYVSMLLLAAMTASASATANSGATASKEQLGKSLFFDSNLSTPSGQACASCHGPTVGWTGPDLAINVTGSVYEGALAGRFGNRKPPASAYAGDSPTLHYDADAGSWVGGMFWDGRATGATLGDPLAEQARGPFLNPLEQNNSDARAVCRKVAASSYAKLFEQVWGSGSLNCSPSKVDLTYERIARSIAAYERSSAVSAFTSKYDYYLKGKAQLTSQERRGLKLFNGKANCANCHASDGDAPLFTDFTYDNLGVPKNPSNPFYYEPDWNAAGLSWVDEGLGGYLKSSGEPEAVYQPELGKFKVPTLRNVDKRPGSYFVKAYGHNGYFKSLEEIVHFYNTRDVAGAGWLGVPWGAPEEPQNVNQAEVGNLGLTADDEAALVAFLRTLSDGYTPDR